MAQILQVIGFAASMIIILVFMTLAVAFIADSKMKVIERIGIAILVIQTIALALTVIFVAGKKFEVRIPFEINNCFKDKISSELVIPNAGPDNHIIAQ